MAYKVSGRVLTVGATQSLSSRNGNTYTKRDLIIAVRKFDRYTGQPIDDIDNTPKFTFMGDRCQRLDGIKAGDVVTVSFDITGRKYEKDGRTEYITDLRPISVDVMNQQQAYVQAAPSLNAQAYAPQPPQSEFPLYSQPGQSTMPLQESQAGSISGKQEDDLPF